MGKKIMEAVEYAKSGHNYNIEDYLNPGGIIEDNPGNTV